MKSKYYLCCAMIVMAALGLQSCSQEINYKVVRQEVITLHDQLMADEDKVMNAKMALDTLALTGLAKIKAEDAKADTATIRTEIKSQTDNINVISDQMSQWMEHFKTDVDGKSNAEAVAYFEQEKIKVKKLDSLYQAALQQSDAYLKKYNIKQSTAKHEHSMHM